MAPALEPSNRILESTPARALKFLGAVSTSRAIQAAFFNRGYSKAIHDRGWELMFTASGYRQTRIGGMGSPAASGAVAELDAWDEPNFRVALAALGDEFPDQAAHVFEGLEPSTGVGAIISVKTLLDRLDHLESGADREATREADHAALKKLAARGITPEGRAHLRGLITAALGAPEPAVTDADAIAEQRAAKRALWGWLNEWSEVAKADIRRRDFLILLGLAKRKKRHAESPPTAGGEDGET